MSGNARKKYLVDSYQGTRYVRVAEFGGTLEIGDFLGLRYC